MQMNLNSFESSLTVYVTSTKVLNLFEIQLKTTYKLQYIIQVVINIKTFSEDIMIDYHDIYCTSIFT